MSRLKRNAIVYKAAYYNKPYLRRCIALVTLRLTSGTRINHPIRYSYKNRADRATVVAIRGNRGKGAPVRAAYSAHDHSFKYRVGKVVRPRKAFDGTLTTCASGIHFFRSRKTAANYL